MLYASQMNPWPIFGFALVGRLFDIVSTRVVSPRLALEGNPLVKRFGWTYAWLTLGLAFLTFSSVEYGIIIGTASCLMGFSNMSVAVLARYAAGEDGLRELHSRAVRRCPLKSYVALTALQYVPVLVLAAFIITLAGDSADNPVTDVGVGMMVWVLAVVVLKFRNLRKHLGADLRPRHTNA